MFIWLLLRQQREKNISHAVLLINNIKNHNNVNWCKTSFYLHAKIGTMT